MSDERKFGVIGLGVMGQNLALNMARHGLPVAVYNRTTSKMKDFLAQGVAGEDVAGFEESVDFVRSLERPRRILIMVQAGRAVDAVIEELAPLLHDGDILIDGGNSYWEDTERRARESEGRHYQFFGMGVSGGEEGALNGPSLMPGGARESYAVLEPTLRAIAAQTDSGACVTYCGRGSAGHFVKMVHNGIEYGDMQLIAEAYDLLRTLGGVDGEKMESIFRSWNARELQSYLIEITADIVNRPDPEGSGLLLDKIVDAAGQKGTGKWTTKCALDLGVPVPTITAAVDGRLLSALRSQRQAAAEVLRGVTPGVVARDADVLAEDVRQALYASKICSYAQGISLLMAGSEEQGYGTDLREVARIWKGGCIIRAVFLDEIMRSFDRNPKLQNLLVDGVFARALMEREQAWRRVIRLAVEHGIAVPAMSASLAYFDSYRRARVPAYMIQAQRDYFGAHTFQRTDRDGTFHHDWPAGE